MTALTVTRGRDYLLASIGQRVVRQLKHPKLQPKPDGESRDAGERETREEGKNKKPKDTKAAGETERRLESASEAITS